MKTREWSAKTSVWLKTTRQAMCYNWEIFLSINLPRQDVRLMASSHKVFERLILNVICMISTLLKSL